MRVGSLDNVRTILALLSTLPAGSSCGGPTSWWGSRPEMFAGCKMAVRWLSLHTGVPAVLVAAVLIAIGYRVLKRSARFAFEVAAVTLALVAASELGWLRW